MYSEYFFSVFLLFLLLFNTGDGMICNMYKMKRDIWRQKNIS